MQDFDAFADDLIAEKIMTTSRIARKLRGGYRVSLLVKRLFGKSLNICEFKTNLHAIRQNS